jgi:hypothetical protein
MPDISVSFSNVCSSMKNWRKEGSKLPLRPKSLNDIRNQIESENLLDHFSYNEENFVYLVPTGNAYRSSDGKNHVTSSENAGTSFALLSFGMLTEIMNTNHKKNAYIDST